MSDYTEGKEIGIMDYVYELECKVRTLQWKLAGGRMVSFVIGAVGGAMVTAGFMILWRVL